jgi:hypothetical protein
MCFCSFFLWLYLFLITPSCGNVNQLCIDIRTGLICFFPACLLQGLWNVTPETGVLDVLPQDYTFFSALADELVYNVSHFLLT